MDEALELENYLPLSFKTRSELDYIQFLWDAFETNYTHGKYQFAFLTYHMLTMSFVYFETWQIKQTKYEDFKMAMVGFNKDTEKELLDAASPFAFWRVNESSILRFLKLIGCDNIKVGSYTALAKERNGTAHANGNIFFSTQAALDKQITEIFRVVAEIQNHSAPITQQCYSQFLIDASDSEEREYPDEVDQIHEILIHANYLSQKDIEICTSFDISKYETDHNFTGIKSLHQSLKDHYGNE